MKNSRQNISQPLNEKQELVFNLTRNKMSGIELYAKKPKAYIQMNDSFQIMFKGKINLNIGSDFVEFSAKVINKSKNDKKREQWIIKTKILKRKNSSNKIKSDFTDLNKYFNIELCRFRGNSEVIPAYELYEPSYMQTGLVFLTERSDKKNDREIPSGFYVAFLDSENGVVGPILNDEDPLAILKKNGIDGLRMQNFSLD